MFEEGYQFVSFDVESLFTNVALNKTINIILDQKLLKTNYNDNEKTFIRLMY